MRQERRRPRNCRIVDLHHSGWTIERIARQEDLSWIQTWRIVAKDRAVPGIYHQPIAFPGKVEVEGVELRGMTKIVIICADDLFNETRPQQPINRLEQSILTAQSAEITLSHVPIRRVSRITPKAAWITGLPPGMERSARGRAGGRRKCSGGARGSGGPG